jgi:hypothetical protein
MNRMLQHKREDSKVVGRKKGSLTRLGILQPHADSIDNGVLTPSASSDEEPPRSDDPIQSSILMIGTRHNEDSKEDLANRYFSFQ